ncbi:hypothetical protein PDJAM_G00165950 [Pangasius djambal]|uniref:Uncharacterized protein n=1 Tax=Pangasius djambal TaxID=1691987 RepID=A0ACC5ZMN1_9TELE|nr:hypothetical protein [Pangasius djambal]
MFYGMKNWILWLSICHISYMSAENLCTSELLISINISAELQSDVLLPCNFNPTLLGSDKTADIAVVWSQRNTTTYNLVEITLQGEVKFWDYKGGRIKSFPKLSESGNFSILLQKVQPYDLSLYHCELFNGTNCRIAYQELQLQLQLNASNKRIYANSRFEKRNDKERSEEKHSSNQHAATAKNKVYDNKPQNHSNIYGNICMQDGAIYINQPH